MHLIEGYLAGLAMIIFIGPVFFFLISTSLKYGFVPGLLVVLGIIVSDILCVIICLYGLAPLLIVPQTNFWITIAGSFILIALGIKYLIAKQMVLEEKIVLNSTHYISFFTKGFLVNFVNPFVFMVWIGLIKYAQESTAGNSTFFLVGTLLGIFSTDLLKAILAKRIKIFINPLSLQWLFRISGLILIGFGIRMLVYFFK